MPEFQNSTFASRAKDPKAAVVGDEPTDAEAKQVASDTDSVEDKAVTPKRPAKKSPRKS